MGYRPAKARFAQGPGGYAGPMRSLSIGTLLLSFTLASGLSGQMNPEWTTNHVPFRVAGNLYYVGSKDLASYLVVTPDGDILVNSNLETSPPQILANIKTLGFQPSDVKVLLISHAHFDHAAGSAGILAKTHARYEVMDADVSVIESGGKPSFHDGGLAKYPPTKVDRVLHDGDEVRLGGTVLTAHLTPGHTKGNTTWTMKVVEGGKSYDVVIVGSTSVLDAYRLHGDPRYPTMTADFEKTFRVLHALPCDIFLGSHGIFFGLDAKYAQLQPGRPNPFIDPAGYRSFVDEKEKAFQTVLAKQSAGK
jgi:metallo-beta-lactamase class B